MAQIFVRNQKAGVFFIAISWVGMATVDIQSEASRHFLGIGKKAYESSLRSSLLIDHKLTGQSDNANVYVFQSARFPCCLVPRGTLICNSFSSPALLPFGSRGSIRFSMDESLTDRWHINSSQKARCHDVLSPSSE